ncbi:DUF3558 domain-containing protein [Streptomyces sp. NPDC048664]|uniref:DUF3558 domain-containing protein n=1 Tax=Streptomyces sp. NPDC048664 TaxID=3154505 RepID=UPI003445C1C2
MHRPAQRDQLDQRDQRDRLDPLGEGERRPDRRGAGLRRLLVCAAAVPAVLVAAGCSSSSSSSDAGSTPSGTGQQSSAGQPSQSTSSAPAVRPAVYGKLPDPCSAVSGKTLGDLVPKSAKSGKKGSSNDPSDRGSCSWTSLQNNGVKGSQFRWLNISLLRFDSDAARGDGNKRAQEYYADQVKDAQSATGAKNTKAEAATGVGDQATAVRYDLKKKEGAFKQQTVVARAQNVVISVDYNGAGLAGDKTPDADDLAKAAVRAAKEAVSAVTAANHGDGGASEAPSKGASPSKSASADPSHSAAKGSAKDASPSASASAAKKD